MIRKSNLLKFTALIGVALLTSEVMAQGGQFIDCSNGGPECEMLYSADKSFSATNCVDCVSGEINVEPAVVKTSYQPLSYSVPAETQTELLPNGSLRTVTTQISGVRSGNVDRQTVHKVERIESQDISGKWVTHDTNEKIAFGDSVHDWDAARGETLKSLLTQWAEVSGWTLIWKLDRDYNLEAGVVFRGTFTEVASAIIRTFARAVPAPIGTFYRGNRVLVISIQEDDNAH